MASEISSSAGVNIPAMLEKITPSQTREGDLFRLFLTTNEQGENQVIDILAKKDILGNTAIGPGGFFLLNAVAKRGTTSIQGKKIEYIIIADCSNKVRQFWTKMSRIIVRSNSKELVQLKLIKHITKHSEQYFNDKKNKRLKVHLLAIYQEIKDGVSWLSSNSQFETIRDIFIKKHFGFALIDYTDAQAMRSLAAVMQENGLTVDTLYLSNIREYAEKLKGKEGVENLRSGIKALRPVLTDVTLVVQPEHRPKGFDSSQTLTQKVYKNIKTSNLEEWFPEPQEKESKKDDVKDLVELAVKLHLLEKLSTLL